MYAVGDGFDIRQLSAPREYEWTFYGSENNEHRHTINTPRERANRLRMHLRILNTHTKTHHTLGSVRFTMSTCGTRRFFFATHPYERFYLCPSRRCDKTQNTATQTVASNGNILQTHIRSRSSRAHSLRHPHSFCHASDAVSVRARSAMMSTAGDGNVGGWRWW